MCGIFGYIGSSNASKIIFEGLKRLEYRGYDSWGIAVLDQAATLRLPRLHSGQVRSGQAGRQQRIIIEKHTGAIGDISLDSSFLNHQSNIGIGHTRWATHGEVSDTNAHPHFSTDKSFVLCQNGIVENYQKLKEKLKAKGYKFVSKTDTEIIVRLIEDKLRTLDSRLHGNDKGEETLDSRFRGNDKGDGNDKGEETLDSRFRGNDKGDGNDKGGRNDMVKAVREAFLELAGRNTIILLTKDGEIIAARNGSPLVVGVNSKTKEIFFSSDTLSFAPFCKKIMVVENGQMVCASNNAPLLIDLKSGKELQIKYEAINFENNLVDKEGFSHYMLKEIHESPYVIRQIVNQNPDLYVDLVKKLKTAKNVYTVGSGTAGIAAAQIAYYLRVFAGIRAVSLIGAEAQEYYDLLTKNDVMIVPSQSGETADVLEVLEVAQKKGVKIASQVNMQGSSISRMSDYKFLAQAGPEISVVSTKVFTSQIAWGYLLAKIASGKGAEGIKNLKKLAEEIEKYLACPTNHTSIKKVAKKLVMAKDIFLLGKYQNFNIVKEGMVKIIEGSYKHAHGIPAGDLKHYAITLMEKGVPVIVVASNDPVKFDVLNAVNEVKARGATVIGISPTPHTGFDYYLPVPDLFETSAIFNIIPLQLLAYYLAVNIGNNVDKPRNIAKSVTVK